MKKAMLWHKEKENVRCGLCARRCLVAEGRSGVCLVRKNIKNALYSLNYGKIIAMNPDPIEKKPMFHFLPGTRAFSIASAGCNFACAYCCNWEISQVYRDTEDAGNTGNDVVGEDYTPKDIVGLAVKNKCKSISYTYTEPTIFFEFAHDTSRLARIAGLKNTFVTNGYMTPEAVKKARYLDAATVNFKASGDGEFYRKYARVPCVEPIFESIKAMKKAKVFLEITNLVVPEYGDDETAFKKLAQWVADELGAETPFHILRFYASYKVAWPETPLAKLEKFYAIAKRAGLHYVYLGNVGGRENTECPECGELLIDRRGFEVRVNLKNGACPKCGRKIPLIDN